MNQEEMRASIKAERESMRDPDEIVVDEERDLIVIYGIRYSRKFFRDLGGVSPVGALLRIEAREDGVLTLREYKPGAQVTA